MADQLQRSDRTDPARYQTLKEAANENEKTRSPGWTDRGDMPAQQASANQYNKAAQEKQLEQHAGKELTDKQRAYLDDRAQKLGPSQPDRGQDRSREMERSRGMDLSR